ncbi:MAG: ABC transporter permease, partial [Tepidisphaeraceae bacterium]
MTLFKTCRTALHALRRNVMRAVLTTLGIVIGVGAVIAMMEIGNGSSKALQRVIASMGANNLLIMPGAAASGGVSWGGGTTQTLTPQDVEAIARECPAVRAVSPIVRSPRGQIIHGNRNWVPQQVQGITADYLNVREWPMFEGEAFSDRDVRNGSKVCIVGQTIVRELFAGASPIGKELRIQNVAFKVVGVLNSKGANMMGSDQDDVILAPWTTIKYRVSSVSQAGSGAGSGAAAAAAASSGAGTSNAVNSLKNLYPGAGLNLYPVPSAIQQADSPLPVRFSTVDQIMLAARSAEEIPGAIGQVTELLRQRHHLRPDEPNDFDIRNMTEMNRSMTSTAELMSKLLLCVAMISLVVGGVGIMNIML